MPDEHVPLPLLRIIINHQSSGVPPPEQNKDLCWLSGTMKSERFIESRLLKVKSECHAAHLLLHVP